MNRIWKGLAQATVLAALCTLSYYAGARSSRLGKPDPTIEKITHPQPAPSKIAPWEDKEEVSLPSPEAKPGPADKATREEEAGEIYEHLLILAKGASAPDTDRTLEILSELKSLGSEDAPFFIARFKESREYEERSVSLQLMFLCGGNSVSEFLLESLNDPAIPGAIRQQLLAAMNEGESSIWDMSRIPFGRNYDGIGQRFLHSGTVAEKLAGASILGRAGGRESIEALKGAVHREGNHKVRAAAIRALGHCGDGGTWDFLNQYRQQFYATYSPKDIGADALMLQKAFEFATRQLAPKEVR